MHMNFHLAFEKEGVPEDKRETVFRYGKGIREKEGRRALQKLYVCFVFYRCNTYQKDS